MADVNRVVLTGRLTRDVELRSTPNGATVGNFGLAVNRRRKNEAGEWIEEANFFNIVVWGRQAENCAQFLAKGSPAAIDGRLQSRSWETEDGQKRNVVEVVADNVQFLGGRGEGGRGGGQTETEFTEIGGGSEDAPF